MIRNIRNIVTTHVRYPSLTLLAHNDATIAKGKIAIRVYYAMLLYAAYTFFIELSTLPPLTNFDPLWPLWWSHAAGIDIVLLSKLIRLGFVIASFAAILWYDKWYVRALVFVSVWQAHALISSFGDINHQWYGWLYTSLILVLIPDSIWRSSATDEARRTFLLVIWWAQATIMLTYTLAGMWKLLIGIEQTLAGEISGFHPLGLAYQIADWLPKLPTEAMFSTFIITHPLVGWAGYLFVQYMQLFAIYTMVRPSLQRFWVFELMTFHVGTFVLMGIAFSQFIPLLMALFLFSPFVPERVTVREILFDMPGIGYALGLVTRNAKRS